MGALSGWAYKPPVVIGSGQESLTGVVKGVGFGLRLLSRQARAELLSGLRRGWGVDVMTPPRCGQA